MGMENNINKNEEVNNLEKYVEMIKKQMLRNGKENYKELDELFASDDFKAVVSEGRIFDFIRNAVGSAKLNMSIVNDLIWRFEKLSKEQPDNTAMQSFIHDLKKVVSNNRSKIIKRIIVIVLIIGVASRIWGLYKKSGPYVISVSPTPEEMSAIVQEEYGITVAPEDITLSCEKNTHYQSKSYYPLVAVYTILYSEDGKEITFTGKRLPIHETETAFDLETSFAQFYITENIDCEVGFTSEYGRELSVKKHLKDEKSAQDFAAGFKEAMTEFFTNPAIADMDCTYYFNLYLLEDDSELSFTLELEQDTYAAQMEALPKSLVFYVKGIEIIEKYESGEYTEEEANELLNALREELEK